MAKKFASRLSKCLFATAAIILSLETPSDANPGWNPLVIRGAVLAEPINSGLVYQAIYPTGSLRPSLDRLRAGTMQLGDTLIANSNPTFSQLRGEILLGITRPVGLSPNLIVSQTAWATPVNFGPGSLSRVSATFRAPIGPLATGGFAMGVVAKTGGKDDIASEPRIAATVNVRPGALVRFNVPFGSAEPTNMVLPTAVRDQIFSATSPKPFTIDLSIDRINGKGEAKLTVGSAVFTLPFTLTNFRGNGGPVITAMGAGIAVNSNGPGQTASVRVDDFRIYRRS